MILHHCFLPSYKGNIRHYKNDLIRYDTQIYEHSNEKFEDYKGALKIFAIKLSKAEYLNRI